MKKSFTILLILILAIGTSLFADKKVEELTMLNDVGPKVTNPPVIDDIGDIIFDIDVQALTGDDQCLGCEYVPPYLWVTGGGGTGGGVENSLYKIDPVAGTLEATYLQNTTSAWGMRDPCYDPVTDLLYAGDDNGFYSIDPSDGTVTTVFTGAIGSCIRALAYDGTHFWTKSFGDPIYEFDIAGNIINTYTDDLSTYGMAYDSFEGCLWLFASPTTFYQYDLNGVPSGVSYTLTLPNGGIIGGAFYEEGGLVPGKTVLGCLGQGDPDAVYGMELRDSAPVDAPGAPTDVVVTPDVAGALEAQIDWVCPVVQVNGDPLTELLEMKVYRDDALIYTDSSPIIGDPGSYTDLSVPSSGTYAYKVVGYNTAGEGISVTVTVWVGEDVPNFVTDLLLEQTNPGVLSGTLTWVNPTTGLNGGAFNEPILGYHIVRSDGTPLEVTGEVTEYIDNTIPIAGTYNYTVQPYNSVGDGGIETSNTVLIADAGLLIMEGFEGGVIPAGWTQEYVTNNITWIVQTGGYSGNPETAHEGTYNAFLYEGGWNGSITKLVTPELDLGVEDGQLTFWHAQVSWIGDQDFLYIYYKNSPTGDWVLLESYNYEVPTWTENIVTLPDPSGTYYVAFEGSLDYGYGVCIDDVMITCSGVTPDPGFIEGHVTLVGGTGNVQDVEVTAGGEITNPDVDGNYSIQLYPGTYDVTATLDGYDPDTVLDVIVEEGLTTSGVDLTLEEVVGVDEIVIAATKLGNNYPNPFNPETNIAFSIKEAGFTTLEVYNMRGQLVKILVNEAKESGNYTVTWDGKDNSNKNVSSGVYFYKMKTGKYVSTRKMILMK